MKEKLNLYWYIQVSKYPYDKSKNTANIVSYLFSYYGFAPVAMIFSPFQILRKYSMQVESRLYISK